MPNPLEMASGPPTLPQQGAGNGLQQSQPAAPAGPAGAPQAMPAPPTHAQTVAALRHFHAIIGEVQDLMRDPALGRSDMKSRIIDGVTKLVSERMISPAAAVQQLSQVPTDPLEQRKWLQTTLQQAVSAANAVVDHHAAGNPGTLDFAQESQMALPHPDQHRDHMEALGANYGRR